MIEAADREMGEKRYLLTLDEIMDIQAMVFLGVVLRRKSLAESSPSDEWLEAHAHHERTCRDDGNGCCSNCGSPAPQSYASALAESPKYCPECGAKVVGE